MRAIIVQCSFYINLIHLTEATAYIDKNNFLGQTKLSKWCRWQALALLLFLWSKLNWSFVSIFPSSKQAKVSNRCYCYDVSTASQHNNKNWNVPLLRKRWVQRRDKIWSGQTLSEKPLGGTIDGRAFSIRAGAL